MKKESKKKFKIITLGCKTSQYGSSALGSVLSSANFLGGEASLGLNIIEDGGYCSIKVLPNCEQRLNKASIVKFRIPQKLIGKIINYKL
jgi:hypothetical protein